MTLTWLAVAAAAAMFLQPACKAAPEPDFGEAKQQLTALEAGETNLYELTDNLSKRGREQIIAYFLSLSNATPNLGMLAACRCLALEQKYREAAALAAKYVRANSNDWRGWRILGGASLEIGNLPDAVMAYTNAVILGDESCYGPLAVSAEAVGRFDLVRDIIPHLLILKQASRTPPSVRLDLTGALVIYAVHEEKEDVFVSALTGTDLVAASRRKELVEWVMKGCRLFEGREAQTLCNGMVPVAPATNSPATKSGEPLRR